MDRSGACARWWSRALAHVAAHGLPGEHHFYITFRTDHPGVVMPPRLRGQYPQEMTIVLQHQFWDLRMDEEAGLVSVGLSFGGVPSSLVVPLAAVIAFADPHVRYGMRFRPEPDADSGTRTASANRAAAAEPSRPGRTPPNAAGGQPGCVPPPAQQGLTVRSLPRPSRPSGALP